MARRPPRNPCEVSRVRIAIACAAALVAAACSTAPKSGPYYQKDGPPLERRDGRPDTPDPLPRVEPIRPANARPYRVMGRDYVPMTKLEPFRERGIASWYGRQFHGEKTASGEPYDMYALSAAHKTLPLPSWARVTNVKNGRSVIVRINDRGPFFPGRVIDLSYAAAVRLGGPNVGLQEVEVELLLPDEIARLRRDGPALVRAEPDSETKTTPIPNAPTGVAATPIANASPVPAVAAIPSTTVPSTGTGDTTTLRRDGPPPANPEAPVVQLGAFSQRANAEALRDRIARERPALADRIDVVFRERLFRLQVGPLTDRIEAATLAADLREFLGVDALVIAPR